MNHSNNGGGPGDCAAENPPTITYEDALRRREGQVPSRPAPPVDVCPRASLRRWRIFELSDSGERRLAGHCVDENTWRTSSPLVSLTIKDMTAITHSGRHYTLEGDPDEPGALAQWIWDQFVVRHRVELSRDVTEMVLLEAMTELTRETIEYLDQVHERMERRAAEAPLREAELRRWLEEQIKADPELVERLRAWLGGGASDDQV